MIMTKNDSNMEINSEIIKEIYGTKPKKLSEIDSAWLAGVIDGEGSIGLYDYGKEGRRVLIQIGNTNEQFVQKVKELIGCGSSINRQHFGGGHKGRKAMYHYTLKGSARCYVILKQIYPYLIIKKDLAERIIKEIETAPFGRWKNCTEESRKKQSEMAKKSWQNPIHRANRILGLKRYFQGGE